GRSFESADAGHGEEQHGGLVDGERGCGERQRVVYALIVARAHDHRDAAFRGFHRAPQVGQSGRLAIVISSKEPASASYIKSRPVSERPMPKISFTTSV